MDDPPEGPRSSKRDASVSVDDDNNDSNLTKEDFVGVILDVLKMQKNICLCRHFQVKIPTIFYYSNLLMLSSLLSIICYVNITSFIYYELF